MTTDPTEPAAEPEYRGRATYCPEDNKLRLYVGRVPREEFLKLRAQGWTALHKQRDAGGGDFVAHWTPDRRDTALEYAGLIEDEDMGPDERAADRAERFGGYRDKRTDDATGHADRYDAGPSAHGYQSQARAERAAARHDRIANRANDAWGKAEYWQRRTEGVIRHALHVAAPGVRMGRIKELEALIRKHEKEVAERTALYQLWQKIAALTDPAAQTQAALHAAGHYRVYGDYRHPRAETLSDYYKNNDASLYSLLSHETDPITGAEACAFYFSDHSEPAQEDDWSLHYRLRLAYENQMLAAQGGRLEQCEVLLGGKLGNKLIIKVSKSTATGRATSVDLLGPKVQGWHYQVSNIPGTEWATYKFELERLSPGAYTPPTTESLAELAEVQKKIKAAKKTTNGGPIPLINPTDEDAERLQALWNEQIKARGDAKRAKDKYSYVPEFVKVEVCRMTQAQYSACSGGTYTSCKTVELYAFGRENSRRAYWTKEEAKARLAAWGPILCKIRQRSGPNYMADHVIVITDKPQKPLPAAMWEDPKPGILAQIEERFDELEAAVRKAWDADRTDAQKEVFNLAVCVGICYEASTTQYGYTEEGCEWAQRIRDQRANTIQCSACGVTTPRSQWQEYSNALFPAAIVCPSCDMCHAATPACKTAPVIGTAAPDAIEKYWAESASASVQASYAQAELRILE